MHYHRLWYFLSHSTIKCGPCRNIQSKMFQDHQRCVVKDSGIGTVRFRCHHLRKYDTTRIFLVVRSAQGSLGGALHTLSRPATPAFFFFCFCTTVLLLLTIASMLRSASRLLLTVQFLGRLESRGVGGFFAQAQG